MDKQYSPQKELLYALRMLGFRKPDRSATMSVATGYFLAALVILSQFLDFGSTYLGITHADAAEGNPGMAYVLHNYGWLGFAAVKTLGTLLLLYITYRRKWASVAVVALYTAVVGWNTYLTLTGL
jgi:hypothetical protein